MRRITITALVLISWAAMSAAPARADEMKKLIDRADLVFKGETSAAVLEMKIKTKSFERSYKIVSWDDSRGKERTLIKILGPALWRGYGTLKIGDGLKLYNPKTNHVTVVSHSMLGDSWMGSHFSNDDLVKETKLSRDYRFKLVKKWSGKSDLGPRSTFYRVALKPTPSAPVAWDRIIYEVVEDGDIVLPLSAAYYRKAKDNKPTRTITFTEPRRLGGRLVPAVMTVTVAKKPGEYTKIVYKKLKLDANLPKSKFTEQALRK